MSETDLGRRVRLRRTELGLSVPELARRIQTEPSALYKIERGTIKDIRVSTLRRLAYHLRTSADWLLGTFDLEGEQESEALAAAV